MFSVSIIISCMKPILTSVKGWMCLLAEAVGTQKGHFSFNRLFSLHSTSFRLISLIWINIQAIQTWISCQGCLSPPIFTYTGRVLFQKGADITSRLWGLASFWCCLSLLSDNQPASLLILVVMESEFHWHWEDVSICHYEPTWGICQNWREVLPTGRHSHTTESMTQQAERRLDCNPHPFSGLGTRPACTTVHGNLSMSIASQQALLFCSLCSSKPGVYWPTSLHRPLSTLEGTMWYF